MRAVGESCPNFWTQFQNRDLALVSHDISMYVLLPYAQGVSRESFNHSCARWHAWFTCLLLYVQGASLKSLCEISFALALGNESSGLDKNRKEALIKSVARYSTRLHVARVNHTWHASVVWGMAHSDVTVRIHFLLDAFNWACCQAIAHTTLFARAHSLSLALSHNLTISRALSLLSLSISQSFAHSLAVSPACFLSRHLALLRSLSLSLSLSLTLSLSCASSSAMFHTRRSHATYMCMSHVAYM